MHTDYPIELCRHDRCDWQDACNRSCNRLCGRGKAIGPEGDWARASYYARKFLLNRVGNCAGEFVAEASDKEQDAFQVPELSTRHQQCQIEQHKHDPILRLILFFK